MAIIHAIYENGVFKPKGPVSLPDGAEVVFEPRLVLPPPEPDADYDPGTWERALAWAEGLKNRTDEEIEEARRRLAANSPRLLSAGEPPEPVPSETRVSHETDNPTHDAVERLP